MTHEQLAKRIEKSPYKIKDLDKGFYVTFSNGDKVIELSDEEANEYLSEFCPDRNYKLVELHSLETPQQLAALAEKQGFVLVPFHPTQKMLEPYIERWGENESFALSSDAVRASKIYTQMIKVGRVKP